MTESTDMCRIEMDAARDREAGWIELFEMTMRTGFEHWTTEARINFADEAYKAWRSTVAPELSDDQIIEQKNRNRG